MKSHNNSFASLLIINRRRHRPQIKYIYKKKHGFCQELLHTHKTGCRHHRQNVESKDKNNLRKKEI